MITAITHARLFDGERVLDPTTVTLEGDRIVDVGGPVPSAAEVVDGRGATILPGLIDAHVHTSRPALTQALRFGVTTELEMQGAMTGEAQARVSSDSSLADVRSSGFALTPPGGHPSELFPAGERPGGPPRGDGPPPVMPFVTTPEEAVSWIPRLVEAGSDYIKVMVDDGTVEGHPGLPCLDQATLDAAVAEAHRLGKLVVAHALTVDSTMSAVRAGVDGLTHVFMDRPHTPEVIEALAAADAFVVACIVLDASMMGRDSARSWPQTRACCPDWTPPGSLRSDRPSTATPPATSTTSSRRSRRCTARVSTCWSGRTRPCPCPTSAASPTARACTTSSSCWCARASRPSRRSEPQPRYRPDGSGSTTAGG